MHLAFERGAKLGCDAIQVFTKNQRQWKARPLTSEEVKLWNDARTQTKISPVVAHDTYLINLAAPDEGLWRRSIEAFVDELQRCEQLGIVGLVTHPGSHCGGGEAWGIERIARALDLCHQHTTRLKTKTLLEVTAGQGTALGHRFEHLAEIIGRVREPQRLGVCLDTCHLFAAGYDISTPAGYTDTIEQLDRLIGLKRVMCIHSNDSKKPLGSRVDRHEHIGKGLIGLAGFRHFVRDPRFFGTPMLIETEKGGEADDDEYDRMNLAALRRLARAACR
jgi:deoxyribonuclease-4